MTTPPPMPQPGCPGVPPGYAVPQPIGEDPETGEPVTSDMKTQAVLAQALSLVGGWLVGLIFRLTSGTRSSFVRTHATAALNVALTQLILLATLVVAFIVTMFVGAYAASRSDDSVAVNVAAVLFVVELLLVLATGITGVALWIVGAVRASRLQPPPRPRVVLRLVKDKPRSG